MYIKEDFDDNFQNPQGWGVDPYNYENDPEWVKQGAFEAGMEAAEMLGGNKSGKSTYMIDIRPLIQKIGIKRFSGIQDIKNAVNKLAELGSEYDVAITVHPDNPQLALVNGMTSDIKNMIAQLGLSKDTYALYDAGQDYVIYTARPLGCVRAYFYGPENDVFTSAREAEEFYKEFKESMEDNYVTVERIDRGGDELIAICGPDNCVQDFINYWEPYMTDIELVDKSEYEDDID